MICDNWNSIRNILMRLNTSKFHYHINEAFFGSMEFLGLVCPKPDIPANHFYCLSFFLNLFMMTREYGLNDSIMMLLIVVVIVNNINE